MQSTKHAYRPHFYDRLFQILTFDEVSLLILRCCFDARRF